jgi:nitrite reductase (cytochrome c-552)
VKISDHHVRSPILNINLAYQTCHRWPETELKARVGHSKAHLCPANLAMDALGLITDLKSARAASMSDAELQARDLQRRAQFFLDSEAENSMGFHAPQEAARILGGDRSISWQGQVAVRDARSSNAYGISVRVGGITVTWDLWAAHA